jgi:hypothetical protein
MTFAGLAIIIIVVAIGLAIFNEYDFGSRK